jgi:hypothetical protein
MKYSLRSLFQAFEGSAMLFHSIMADANTNIVNGPQAYTMSVLARGTEIHGLTVEAVRGFFAAGAGKPTTSCSPFYNWYGKEGCAPGNTTVVNPSVTSLRVRLVPLLVLPLDSKPSTCTHCRTICQKRCF